MHSSMPLLVNGILLELVAIFQPRVILQPELDRVHPQLLGDDVHVNFLGEGSLGMTHAAHGAGFRVVGINRIALAFHVGATVGRTSSSAWSRARRAECIA